MSRNIINEEAFFVGTHLRKGMDSMTILDPGKLRVPFGGNKTPRKQNWMNVDSDTPIPSVEAVIEVPKPKTQEESSIEVPGWVLAAGFTLFAMCLALCNLLAPQYAGRVCTTASPIPVLCLLLLSLHRQVGAPGVVISALLLPSVCVWWNLYLSIPFVLLLSVSAFACIRQRDILAWVCLFGACLALLLALPVQLLEPKWGLTVAIFFSCVLCFLSGLGVGRVGLTIKTLQ
jgi:hypothetical protein